MNPGSGPAAQDLDGVVGGDGGNQLMVRTGGSLLRRFWLGVQVGGFRETITRVWTRLFGKEEQYVFIQYLKPPAIPVDFPITRAGLTVRRMTAQDLTDVRVRRHEPREDGRLTLGVVATREGQLVGAAWYIDSVGPEQPWYRVVEPHLILPALLDANLFVVAGEKGAAWAISKHGTDFLATNGIRSTVALVGTENTRSILLLRLFGARIVARMSTRYWFGRRTAVAHPVSHDTDTALRSSGRTSSPG